MEIGDKVRYSKEFLKSCWGTEDNIGVVVKNPKNGIVETSWGVVRESNLEIVHDRTLKNIYGEMFFDCNIDRMLCEIPDYMNEVRENTKLIWRKFALVVR